MAEFAFAKELQNSYNFSCLRETNLNGRSTRCVTLIAASSGRFSDSCAALAADTWFGYGGSAFAEPPFISLRVSTI